MFGLYFSCFIPISGSMLVTGSIRKTTEISAPVSYRWLQPVFSRQEMTKMTHSEAEELIMTLINSGGPMDISEVMQKYEGKTLREAYLDFFFEIDPFGDQLDEILSYHGPGK